MPAPLPASPFSDASAPQGGRKRSPFLVPAGVPGLPPTLDFVTGPDDAACLAAGLVPVRPHSAASALLVRYRGVGNNAVKSAFKAAGYRREALVASSSLAPSFVSDDHPGPTARWAALWGGQLAAGEYAQLKGWQRVNHWPLANTLGRKDRLARALRAAQAACDVPGAFDFVPRTFCLPTDHAAWAAERRAHGTRKGRHTAPLRGPQLGLDGDDEDVYGDDAGPSDPSGGDNEEEEEGNNAALVRGMSLGGAATSAPHAAAPDGGRTRSGGARGGGGSTSAVSLATRLYLAKPPALSRGRGVHVCPADQVPLGAKLLVQRYIHPPHVIDGLKYDLRLYVLLTSVEPLRAYVHSQGLVRFATAPYDASSMESAAHITNVSVRSKPGAPGQAAQAAAQGGAYVANAGVAQDDVGHKWSLAALKRRLDATHGPQVWPALWARLCDLVARTLVAATGRMAPAAASSGSPQGCSFELYGFDVLLDADLKPWLLEVNTGPNLASPSPLDMHVKYRVAAEMMHLVGLAMPPITQAEEQAHRQRLAAQAEFDARAFSSGVPPTAPLDEQPFCVRAMVGEHSRRGGWCPAFPSDDPHRNAQLLRLLRPSHPGTDAMCAYVAAHAQQQTE